MDSPRGCPAERYDRRDGSNRGMIPTFLWICSIGGGGSMPISLPSALVLNRRATKLYPSIGKSVVESNR